MTVETITLGDISMKYAKFGCGKRTLVIIPGLSLKAVTLSAEAVEQGFGLFADGWTVYLVDRRMNPPEGYTVEMMACDTAAVLNELGIRGADVFGASQGGMMGLYIAAGFPEIVGKLAVASTVSCMNEVFERNLLRWVELAKAGEKRRLVEEMTDLIYSENTLKLFRDAIIGGMGEISDGEIRDFIVNSEACLGYDVTSELTRISCPSYVWGSEGDKVLTPEGSYELAKGLKCGIYMYGSEYGHGVYDEAPDFREAMKAFFEK